MVDEQKLTEPEQSRVDDPAEVLEKPEPGLGEDSAAEAARYKDLYLRSVAEMDNMRRRFMRDREELTKYASEALIKELLSVLDNLERALAYGKDSESPELKGLADGINMTLTQAWEVLARHGLEPIEIVRGCEFDPNHHDAIGYEPAPDVPAGTVCTEVQRGYKLKDRLIRPARIMVAAGAS